VLRPLIQVVVGLHRPVETHHRVLRLEMFKEAIDSWCEFPVETGYGVVNLTQWPAKLLFQSPVAGAAQAGGRQPVFPLALFHNHQIVCYPH